MMTNKDYNDALEWLFAQTPNYQLDGKKAYKPGLENIIKLCRFFGNPQEKLKTIHIGGTNGKGSTSNMLSSVLQEAGFKVGLYTSPHLVDFTERVKINGENVDRNFVYDFIQKLKEIPNDILPSFFEFTTILAFDYFTQQEVDYAIIEVGLGGRLDSTNIIHPLVTAITNVEMDHQNILGNSIEEIALEKAGIIKKGIPIISGDDNSIIRNLIKKTADEKEAPFIDASLIEAKFETDLKGNYQQKNRKVVLALVNELRKQDVSITDENIRNGLLHVHENTGFIGRWFEFSKEPLVICDTAHNKAGLDMVFKQLNEIPMRKHIVLGFVEDKKIDEVLTMLPENSCFYFVKPNNNRGRNPMEYEDVLKNAKINYQIFQNVNEGYLAAKQSVAKNEMIFIGGSNFIIGDFLEKNLEE